MCIKIEMTWTHVVVTSILTCSTSRSQKPHVLVGQCLPPHFHSMWFRCEVDPLAFGAVPLNLGFRERLSPSQPWPRMFSFVRLAGSRGKEAVFSGRLVKLEEFKTRTLVAILATTYGVPRKMPTQRKADPRNGETEPWWPCLAPESWKTKNRHSFFPYIRWVKFFTLEMKVSGKLEESWNYFFP